MLSLGVPCTATAKEIRKAYRKASLKCHPDRILMSRSGREVCKLTGKSCFAMRNKGQSTTGSTKRKRRGAKWAQQPDIRKMRENWWRGRESARSSNNLRGERRGTRQGGNKDLLKNAREMAKEQEKRGVLFERNRPAPVPAKGKQRQPEVKWSKGAHDSKVSQTILGAYGNLVTTIILKEKKRRALSSFPKNRVASLTGEKGKNNLALKF